MQPFREVYWNIASPGWLYLFVLVSLATLAFGILRNLSRFITNTEFNGKSTLRDRGFAVWTIAILQKRLRREKFPGIMHLLLFWGFIGLSLGTVLVGLEKYLHIKVLQGKFYLIVMSLGIDLAGISAVIGVLLAIYRRLVQREKRLINTGAYKFGIILGLIIAVLLSGFMVEGLRIAASGDAWGRWSPGGWLLSLPFSLVWPHTTILALHQIFWWIHAFLALVFIAYVPFSPLAHSIYAFLLAWRSPSQQVASLNQPSFSAGNSGLKMSEELGSLACVECGRCEVVCPAYSVQRPLSPRRLISGIRQSLDSGSSVSGKIEQEVIWSCTTCAACNNECPINIKHVPMLVNLRRKLIEKGDIPLTVTQALESLKQWGNPWNEEADKRWSWAGNLKAPLLDAPAQNVEVLYWTGCTAAYDPQARNITKAMIEILNRAGINYAVLGSRERCCGDMARRLGEEGLFEDLMEKNIALFKDIAPKNILTSCPHCFQVFKDEYRGIPEDIKITHYASFLSGLFTEGRLKPVRELNSTLTYHDPCYLGRYQGEYNSARDIIHTMPGVTLIEMPRNHSSSFCCGGGGGQAWLDVRGQDRINNVRLQEAVEAEAEKLITACPYCNIMFSSAANAAASGSRILVQDLAEFVLERV